MKFRSLFCLVFVLFATYSGYSFMPDNGRPPPAFPVDPLVEQTSLEATISPPGFQVLKLVQSNVPDEVILAYIENSADQFGLTPETIIYLDNAGVNSAEITAMLRHDRQLREAAIASQNQTSDNSSVQPTPPPSDTMNPPPQPADSFDNLPSQTDSGDDYADAQEAGDFSNALAPYGSWSQLPGYGSCWQPSVCKTDHNWRPYCDQGQWFFTDRGWYWNSYYPWGWAPFHYGRWLNHPDRGWLWCPGKQWAPSWVTWRDSEENIGWAPLPPRNDFAGKSGFRFDKKDVSKDFGFGLRPNDFAFVPAKNFSAWNLRACLLDFEKAINLFPDTRVVNNLAIGPDGIVLNPGLDVNLVAADSHKPIIRARLKDSPTLEGAGYYPSLSDLPTVKIFRPPLTGHGAWNSPGGPFECAASTMQSLALPAQNPGALPAQNPGAIPAMNPGALPAQNPGALPAQNPGALPVQNLGALPAENPGALPAENPANAVVAPNQFPEDKQPFRFNREFPKIILNRNAPPFAPAGTIRVSPQFHNFSTGQVGPHASPAFSTGGGHHG